MHSRESVQGRIGVDAAEVVRVWTAADSPKSPETRTGGILQAFLRPGVVESWYREPLTEILLRDLRLLGGPLEYPWGQLSDGTFLVASCRLPESADITAEPWPLALVSLQRRDRADRRVLIDGCQRPRCSITDLVRAHTFSVQDPGAQRACPRAVNDQMLKGRSFGPKSQFSAFPTLD